jgi:hypothetical protein
VDLQRRNERCWYELQMLGKGGIWEIGVWVIVVWSLLLGDKSVIDTYASVIVTSVGG